MYFIPYDYTLDVEYIVTGGAGFIGANLVKKLLATYGSNADLRIDVLDCLTYSSNLENLPLDDNRVKLYEVDISDNKQVALYLQNDYVFSSPTVFHLAAESHVDRSIADGSNFITTNVSGTFNMLTLANDVSVKCFVHVSTDEVYGSVESSSSDENYPLNPTSYYSSSKASSDLVALSAFKTLGIPVVVTRCVNNFGEGQHPEKFLPRMIERLNRNLSLPVYGDGLNIREWIYVQDHVTALMAIASSEFAGEVFNIGTGLRLSNLDIVNKLLSFSKSKSKIEFIVDRLGHDRRYALNSEKIKTATTWQVLDSEIKFDTYLQNSLKESANGNFVDNGIFELSEEFYRGT
jgi:dTDP-glucose 4,6-dehydratase